MQSYGAIGAIGAVWFASVACDLKRCEPRTVPNSLPHQQNADAFSGSSLAGLCGSPAFLCCQRDPRLPFACPLQAEEKTFERDWQRACAKEKFAGKLAI